MTSPVTLVHPVCTLENRMLLPAGTSLSMETVDSIVSSNIGASYKTCSFLQYGFVREDMKKLLVEPPYAAIFEDQNERGEILHMMEQVNLILPMLEVLDYFRLRDFHTYRHILMVFALSTVIAKDLLPDSESRLILAATGPAHDFGKICVPLEILKKESPLTRTERSIVEQHTTAGYVLLSYYLRDRLNIAAEVAWSHHERRDGSGYPRGISLKDFMVEIIAVSDVYDALISPRSYRPVSYDNRTALEEITRMAERKEVGWDIVRAFIARNRKDKPHYTEGSVSTEKRGTPPAGNMHGILADDEEGMPG